MSDSTVGSPAHTKCGEHLVPTAETRGTHIPELKQLSETKQYSWPTQLYLDTFSNGAMSPGKDTFLKCT